VSLPFFRLGRCALVRVCDGRVIAGMAGVGGWPIRIERVEEVVMHGSVPVGGNWKNRSRSVKGECKEEKPDNSA